MRQGRKRSAVWNYFQSVNGRLYCTRCDFSTHTIFATNLKNHLKYHHPAELEEVKRLEELARISKESGMNMTSVDMQRMVENAASNFFDESPVSMVVRSQPNAMMPSELDLFDRSYLPTTESRDSPAASPNADQMMDLPPSIAQIPGTINRENAMIRYLLKNASGNAVDESGFGKLMANSAGELLRSGAIRRKFNIVVSDILARRQNSHATFDRNKYQSALDALIRIESGDRPRNTEEFTWIKKYSIGTSETGERYLQRTNGKRVAVLEDLFDIVSDSHLRTGHGGRDAMLRDLGEKYENVSRSYVMLLLRLCKDCQARKSKVEVDDDEERILKSMEMSGEVDDVNDALENWEEDEPVISHEGRRGSMQGTGRRGPKRRHPVWGFFDDDRLIARCKRCDFRTGSMFTTNLKNHLKSHHSTEYDYVIHAETAMRASVVDDNETDEAAGTSHAAGNSGDVPSMLTQRRGRRNLDDCSFPYNGDMPTAKHARYTSLDSPQTNGSSGAATGDGGGNSFDLLDDADYGNNGTMQTNNRQCNRALAALVSRTMGFGVVELPEFQEFVRLVSQNPEYKLPDQRSLIAIIKDFACTTGK